MTPFFLVALLFVAAAPTFWHLVEIQQVDLPEASENAELYQEIEPVLSYGGERLRAGEFPAWNERQWMGEPFLANPAHGVFQPLHGWAFFVPRERALAIHAFVSLVLMGLFFVLLGRSLGVGYLPAVIGALTYTFCGASAAAMSRPDLASVLVWSPLLLWAIREWVRLGRRSMGVLAGLAGGLILVSGSVAMAMAVFVLAAPYAVWVSTFLAEEGRQTGLAGRGAGLALAVVVACVVGAVQWAPGILWILEGRAVENVWNARAAAQLPRTGEDLLTQILSATPGALPRIGYVGALPLLLASVAVFHKGGGRDAWFFLFMGLVLTGLAFMAPWGEASRHFPWWVAAYPVVLAVAVLTALGADRLIPARRHVYLSSLIPPVILVMFVFVGVFVLAGAQIRGYLIAFAVLTIPALFVRRWWMARGVWVCWMILLFADLTAASVNAYLHPFQDGEVRRERLERLAAVAEEYVGDGRVFVAAHPNDVALPRNIGLLTGLRVVNGTGAGYPDEHAAWWRRIPGHGAEEEGEDNDLLPGARLLRYAGARVILVGRDAALNEEEWAEALPGLRVVGGDALTVALLDERALPWATWYTEWEVEPDLERTVERMLDPGFPFGRRCIVEASPRAPDEDPEFVTANGVDPVPGTAGGNAFRIEIRQRDPERIVLEVESGSEGVLVLADQYDRNWRAEANGEPVRIVRANGIFRGIALDAGEHEIVLEYAPRALQIGLWISIVGLSVLVIAGWIGVARAI